MDNKGPQKWFEGGINDAYRGKGLTSLTLLIIRHLTLNTILNKIAERLYIVDREEFKT